MTEGPEEEVATTVERITNRDSVSVDAVAADTETSAIIEILAVADVAETVDGRATAAAVVVDPVADASGPVGNDALTGVREADRTTVWIVNVVRSTETEVLRTMRGVRMTEGRRHRQTLKTHGIKMLT